MERRTVDVLPRGYQPTKAELEATLKVNASPKKLAKHLLQPVAVREKPVTHRRIRERRT